MKRPELLSILQIWANRLKLQAEATRATRAMLDSIDTTPNAEAFEALRRIAMTQCDAAYEHHSNSALALDELRLYLATADIPCPVPSEN